MWYSFIALLSLSYNLFITSSSLEFVGEYMIIIDVAGFTWNMLINILSECDITSHSTIHVNY